jgi:hypothetical protein
VFVVLLLRQVDKKQPAGGDKYLFFFFTDTRYVHQSKIVLIDTLLGR